MENFYIYETTDLLNGKNYIGQRKTPKGKTPITDKYIGSGSLLTKAIKIYGIENFRKRILIQGIYCRELLDKFEASFIAIYRSIGKAEYNILNGGSSCPYGDKFKQTMKEAMSRPEVHEKLKKAYKARKIGDKEKEHLRQKYIQWLKNTNYELYQNYYEKKVICIETKEIFNSIVDVFKIKNIRKLPLLKCCQGKTKKCKGFHWSFYEDGHDYELPIKIKKPRKKYYKPKKPIEENKCVRKIICLETLEVFNSIKEASDKMNLYYGSVMRVVFGHKKTVRGYHFEYYYYV
jgi:hypothetical protein